MSNSSNCEFNTVANQSRRFDKNWAIGRVSGNRDRDGEINSINRKGASSNNNNNNNIGNEDDFVVLGN